MVAFLRLDGAALDSRVLGGFSDFATGMLLSTLLNGGGGRSGGSDWGGGGGGGFGGFVGLVVSLLGYTLLCQVQDRKAHV